MRILLINHYAGSPEMGMEFRPYYFAKEWMKKGHEVVIIAGDYSHLRRKNPTVTADLSVENLDGIDYWWIKTGQYKGNGVKRALSMVRFCVKLLRYSKKIINQFNPDVVISSSTYPIDTFPAQYIAKKTKARLIHEVHDMWPATLIEIGGMKRWNPFVIAMQIGENSAYKHSDYVVSLPPCAEKYMLKHGLKKGKFVSISNGIVEEDWKSPTLLPEEHYKVLEKLKQENKFIVGYFGGHALSNALDVLVEAAVKEQDKDIHFVLVGDGGEKEKLQEAVYQNNLQNVLLLPPISKKSIPKLLEYFDCSYLGGKKSNLYRFGLSMNKLFDSMYAKCPIILGIESPLDYVEKFQCGVSICPENADAIVHAIEKLKIMPNNLKKEMGIRGHRAVQKYFRIKYLAERFEELFDGEKR